MLSPNKPLVARATTCHNRGVAWLAIQKGLKRMNTKRAGIAAIAGLVCIALGTVYLGYHSNRPASAAKQWTRTIEGLSLVPIYPLREDVQVGDIYLSVNSGAVASNVLPQRRIGHMDVSSLIDDYDKSRVLLPGGAPLKSGNVPGRFRSVAIPGVRLATVDSRAADAGELFGLSQSARANGSLSAAISVSSVTELSLPDDNTVINALMAFCKSPSGFWTFNEDRINFSLGQMIDTKDEAKLAAADPTVFVITQVFYAGSIDVSVAQTSGLNGQAERKRNSADGSAKDQASTDERSLGSEDKPRSNSIARSEPLASFGINATVAFSDDQTLLLKQQFDRPMAFAVTGISLKVRGTTLSECNLVAASAQRGNGRFLSDSLK
jgi:hypothetical protein